MPKAKTTKSRKHAAGVNAEVFKALADPLRGRIFVILSEQVASPREISEMLEESLENVAYHCRVMAKKEVGLIELIGTDKKHGGTQHFYRATARPVLDTDQWERVPRPVREVGTVSVGQLMVGDLSQAIKMGTFDSRPARSMLRMNMVLDEEGFEDTASAAMAYLDALTEIQAQAAERLSEQGKEGFNVATATLVYPKAERSSS